MKGSDASQDLLMDSVLTQVTIAMGSVVFTLIGGLIFKFKLLNGCNIKKPKKQDGYQGHMNENINQNSTGLLPFSSEKSCHG